MRHIRRSDRITTLQSVLESCLTRAKQHTVNQPTVTECPATGLRSKHARVRPPAVVWPWRGGGAEAGLAADPCVRRRVAPRPQSQGGQAGPRAGCRRRLQDRLVAAGRSSDAGSAARGRLTTVRCAPRVAGGSVARPGRPALSEGIPRRGVESVVKIRAAIFRGGKILEF